jgi:hypothetical protein
MSVFPKMCLVAAVLFASIATHASTDEFSGAWYIDLRTSEQKAQNLECGEASFVLKQVGNKVTGSHTMATVGCGRINEGGEGSVKGSVAGNRAVLLVTSGRNGAIVKGVATLKDGSLYWEAKEEVKAGQPEGDSPLILGKGLLTKNNR